MALSVLPTAAFAEDGGENLPACICETACTAEEMNIACPGCGAEGAQPENCALYTKVPDMDDQMCIRDRSTMVPFFRMRPRSMSAATT